LFKQVLDGWRDHGPIAVPPALFPGPRPPHDMTYDIIWPFKFCFIIPFCVVATNPNDSLTSNDFGSQYPFDVRKMKKMNFHILRNIVHI
jgi:hypothetical protein